MSSSSINSNQYDSISPVNDILAVELVLWEGSNKCVGTVHCSAVCCVMYCYV